MDVKNAFLNGKLAEKVYMRPSPGYTCQENKVCRLRKALYGLKQAPRAWFAKFHKTITQLNFSSSAHDSTLFIRKTKNGTVVLLLYVDDMIITGDDSIGIKELKQFLCQHFEMKDLGPLSYFLGLEVLSSGDGLFLSQAKYASDLVSQAGLTGCKIEHTTLEPNIRFTPQYGTLLNDATFYRQLVGSLIYLTVTRRIFHTMFILLANAWLIHAPHIMLLSFGLFDISRVPYFMVFITQLCPHQFL